MATFRKIHVNFWSDSYVSELTPEKKLFYIYLLTNDKTSTCGIYEITKRQMSFDTGYTVDTIDKLLEFLDNSGKVKYCKETQEICILNWKRYNNSKSPKVQALIATELQKVKNKAFIQYVSPSDTVSIEYQTKSDVEIEIEVDIEVEKEIEIEKKADFENSEKTEIFNSKFPLDIAMKNWLKNFPNYVIDKKKDYAALRNIIVVLQKKEPSFLGEDAITETIDSFCVKVKSNQFYRDKSLSTISNKIQDILMATNGLPSPPKKSGLDSGMNEVNYEEAEKLYK